jgi:hypothetical protein
VVCSSQSTDEGFATPAATVLCLAISLCAAAVTASSVSTLQLVRHDYERDRAEAALTGGQLRAALVMTSVQRPSRLRWSLQTDDGPMQVLAEPEEMKVGPVSAAELDDGILRKLGVSDPDGLRNRLSALGDGKAIDVWVGDLDAASAWRSCGPSLASAFGMATAPKIQAAVSPRRAAVSWGAGQVWRIRVVESHGWADDRLVRLTGNPAHPAEVIERLLSRGGGTEQKCDALLAAN